MWPIPSWMLEVGNGTLALFTPWVLWTCARYLRRMYQDEYATLYDFYRSEKMTIALFFILFGSELRSIVTWAVRHANNHQIFFPKETFQALLYFAGPIFSFGTLAMLVGLICWGRVARDIPVTRPSIWLITLACIAVSYWMATTAPF